MIIDIPKMDLVRAEINIALSVNSLFTDCGFAIQNVPCATPSNNTLKYIMIDEAVDYVLLK